MRFLNSINRNFRFLQFSKSLNNNEIFESIEKDLFFVEVIEYRFCFLGVWVSIDVNSWIGLHGSVSNKFLDCLKPGLRGGFGHLCSLRNLCSGGHLSPGAWNGHWFLGRNFILEGEFVCI